MKIYTVQFQVTHWDAMQGNGEEQKESYREVQRLSTASTDAAVCPELKQGFWLCQKARFSGE